MPDKERQAWVMTWGDTGLPEFHGPYESEDHWLQDWDNDTGKKNPSDDPRWQVLYLTGDEISAVEDGGLMKVERVPPLQKEKVNG